MSDAKGRYFDDRAAVAKHLSAQPCGCDAGLGWQCDRHRPAALPTKVHVADMPEGLYDKREVVVLPSAPQRSEDAPKTRAGSQEGAGTQLSQPKQLSLFPGSDSDRKALPVWSGVVMYFPRALREIARVSQVGNDQHNPGQPLHWAKEKSTDQVNTAMRHAMDPGVGNHRATDGPYHQAKACWRQLAELELFLEQQENANGNQK